MSTLNISSSWIASARYVSASKLPDMPEAVGTDGFLLISTKEGHRYAYAVPSWIAGLIVAHKSAGRAFSLLVKGKWPSVKLS